MSEVIDLLREFGWSMPEDYLAHEIIREAVSRWGAARTAAGLRRHLEGPYPSYTLEPIGKALGEPWECPHQLIRIAAE